MDQISTAIEACEWSASHFLIFSANVFDPLIYYSHLTALVLSLGLGLFVLLRSRTSLVTRLLFLMTFALSVWLFGDLVVWATEYQSSTLFFWSIINLVEPFVYALSFYFVYVFLAEKDLPFKGKLVVFLPLLVPLVLTPTSYAMLGYDLSNCDRDAAEGPLVYYNYILEICYTLGIIALGATYFARKKSRNQRAQLIIVTLGTVFFLLSFAFGNIIGSLFSDSEVLGEYSWTIGQYGLFGIPVFVALLSYMIVRFKAFNIGLLAAQALIIGLVAILAAEFAFVTTLTNQILVGITLILTGALGIMLIRSVRREVEQRQHIEVLARNLEKSNQQQVVLIHFITHQLKGFVTKSRNLFSMMLDGDYGPVPENIKPMLEEGLRSDTKGVNTIQEILNAANIKSGKVTYDKTPFNFKELVESIANDLKPSADAKAVMLTVHADTADFTLPGDKMQLTNAVKNLIDNSIKYTPKGNVTVSLTRESSLIRLTIEDTGVGITPEDMQLLFTEGGHGKESQKVNVESTGFGLYIVKNIIEAHQGKVWAESEGAGKGSRFIAELPVT